MLSFKNTYSNILGPESIGIDIAFIGSQHVYGIPEHSTGLSLRSTKYESSSKINWTNKNNRGDNINEDPYRLYNLDVFEYELDKTMALYHR